MIVAATIGVVIAVYLVSWRIAGQQVDDATKELAGSVVFRISALHGLIIGLVFAQLALGFRTLETDTIGEARVIGDIFFDAARHGGDETAEIQGAARRYVAIVLDEEWPALSRGTSLSDTAWDEWETMYAAVLSLEADTLERTALHAALLENVRRLAHLRDLRERHSFQAGRQPFWFAAISGLILMSMGYFAFPPTRRNIALLCLFGTYSGIIFYLVYSFSSPFTPPGALQPTSLERLRATISVL